MLGAGSADVSNLKIVRNVFSIPPLSVMCTVVALFMLAGFLVVGALVVSCLCPVFRTCSPVLHRTSQTARADPAVIRSTGHADNRQSVRQPDSRAGSGPV